LQHGISRMENYYEWVMRGSCSDYCFNYKSPHTGRCAGFTGLREFIAGVRTLDGPNNQKACRSKVRLQVGEFFYLNQSQTVRRGINRLMFQCPREIMRHKNGVDAGGQRRVDV
jgi:hypothetical protein